MHEATEKSNKFLNAALEYARLGYPVFPCHPGGKTPLTQHGFKDASTNPDQIRAWWRNWPEANVAIATAGLVAIDCDGEDNPWPGDDVRTDSLVELRPALAETPRGGHHWVFRQPEGKAWRNTAGKTGLAEKVDTRANGGYIVAAPSEVGGRAYQWLEGHELNRERESLPEPPGWLVEALDALAEGKGKTTQATSPESADVTGGGSGSSTGGDPDNWREPIERDYESRTTWAEILQPHGWVHVGDTKEGWWKWRRPGKEDGHSATTGVRFSGNDVLHVFSGNAHPFEGDGNYGKFRAYAILNHSGSLVEAASALRSEGFGLPDPAQSVDLGGFRVVKGGDGKPVKPATSNGKPMPQRRTVRELIRQFPKLRDPLIHGLLRRGETMNIVAAPKVGKSWLVADLAFALATGRDWIGYRTERGRVMVVDAELHEETSSFRCQEVLQVEGLTNDGDANDGVEVVNLRGHLATLASLQESLFGDIRKGEIDLVVLDACYRFRSGEDENANGEMTALYDLIDRLAFQTGAAFVVIHHATKGSQAVKSVTDVGAGAGSQSRAADTHLVVREHQEDGCAVVEAVTRSWPSPMPVCLRWTYPVWRVDPSLDPADLKGLRRQSSKGEDCEEKPVKKNWNISMFVEEFLGPVPQSRAEILDAVAGSEDGLSLQAAERYLSIIGQGKCEHAFKWGGGRGNPTFYATVPPPEKSQDLPESSDTEQPDLKEQPSQSEDSRTT